MHAPDSTRAGVEMVLGCSEVLMDNPRVCRREVQAATCCNPKLQASLRPAYPILPCLSRNKAVGIEL